MDKTYSINRIYQILMVNILKNLNHKYFSYYIIKFLRFMSIYYTMNLDIVPLFIFFSNLYLKSIYLLRLN